MKSETFLSLLITYSVFLQNRYRYGDVEDEEEEDDEMEEEEEEERVDNEADDEDGVKPLGEQSERDGTRGRQRNGDASDVVDRQQESGTDDMKSFNQRRTARQVTSSAGFSNENSLEHKRSLVKDRSGIEEDANDHDEIEEEEKTLSEGRKVGSYSLRSVRSSRIHIKHQEQQDDSKRRSFRKKSEVQRFNPVTPTKRRRASTRELLDIYLRKRPKRNNTNYDTDDEESITPNQYEFADRETTNTDSLPTPINFPRNKLSKGIYLYLKKKKKKNKQKNSFLVSRRCGSNDH